MVKEVTVPGFWGRILGAMMTLAELHELAWTHADAGRVAEAAATFREAIGVAEAEDGPNSPDIANLATDLAVVLEDASEYGAAEGAARRAIAVLDGFAERDETLAAIEMRAHGVLSMSLRAMGRFPEARREIFASLAVAERHFGPTHALTASALTGVGMFCKFSGEFAEAERAYLRGQAILTDLHGPESVELANTHHNLGGLYHAQGQYAKAEPHGRRAVLLRRAALGADHPAVVSDEVALAGILDGMGPSEESERIYRRALDFWRAKYGDSHYEVATTLHNLAALRRDFGRAGEAVDLFGEALVMKRRLLGDSSPDTALTAACLAQLLYASGRSREALPLCQLAVDAYAGNCQPGHPDFTAIRELLDSVKKDLQG